MSLNVGRLPLFLNLFEEIVKWLYERLLCERCFALYVYSYTTVTCPNLMAKQPITYVRQSNATRVGIELEI